MAHYLKPGPLGTRFNAAVGWLARHGISIFGSAELAVLGRTSGEWRRIPVNPLDVEGSQYLVSARGHSQWVRNLRAAGGGELRVGRRVRRFTAVELPDGDAKAVVLRVYLKRWGFEVGTFFGEINAKSSDEEILRAAPRHPVFRITTAE
ncbi:nitroreductase family deazaflavin-dependent oxidoreductase [Streptomyces sp. 8N706]|uniref:nitroreductase family deazaflavin-dependent oxidoreductase n=1 Tax=Streptomyces sp. 8N706 TaxID=3457416 RepID=UPI003FD07D48